MIKLVAIVALVLIATWSQVDSKRHKKDASESGDYDSGTGAWSSSLSCDSCGSECASACGTRHFRSCCFNYLRRKRAHTHKIIPETSNNLKLEDITITKMEKQKLPMFVVENIPEPWTLNKIPSDYRPYPYDDMIENRFYDV